MTRASLVASLSRSCLLLALALALAGCGDDDAPAEPVWGEVFTELPGALISVHGTSASDVWSVGGDAGDGPFVLHFDGSEWTRLATGQTGDLWWVHAFPGGTVFAGGEGGMIVRYQGGAWERMDTPGTGTVFGIWGTAADDVWAVGGSGTQGGFAWRFDGTSWRDVALPDGLHDSASIFKVWGLAADDVWLVGTRGTLLHWDGAAFEARESGTTRTLFTVHAVPGRVVAVGGAGSGTVIESDGDGPFRDVSPDAVQQTIGVWLDGLDDGWIVGINGSVSRYRDGAWVEHDTGFGLAEAFHATWVDPGGGVWAVGGQVLSEPLIQGIMLHRGAEIPGGTYRE